MNNDATFKDDEKRMSFLDHLEELRWALIKILAATAVGFAGSWIFREEIRSFLVEPLLRVLPEGSKSLVFTQISEGFVTYLWISGIAGFILTSPVSFYFLWRFIAPGLYRNERKYVVTFVSVSSVLFICGAIMAYYFVFPIGFTYFLQFGGANVRPMIRLSDYLRFTSEFLVAFGIVFETPLIIIFLTKMGVVNHSRLVKNRKYVILIIFIAAAIFTPPDVVSQMMMAIPLLVLFELSIQLSRFFGKKPSELSSAS